MASSDVLANLFNALPDSAPGGANAAGTYVSRASSPEYDAVENLKQYIKWAPVSNETYLFSGLRGSGKTTELNRLIAELRDEGVAAYYCDASAYLNLNDPQLGLTELLMTALAGLEDATRAAFGAGAFEDTIWQRIKRLMKSDVEIKPSLKLEGAGVGVEIETTLQENPDFRRELVEFARQSSGFYDEATKYAEEVAKKIRSRTQCKKIVLVVDSLERLSAPTGDEAKLFDSLKEIFFNDPVRLRFPSFSVVYSAPPYLHAVLPSVGGGFSQTLTLPNFKVIDRPQGESSPQRNAEGIDKMVDIVARRFPAWESAFSRPVLEHLAWMSGGNVRRYFSLVRAAARKAALSKAELPIVDPNAAPVAHAVSEAAQPLQWLTAKDRIWLGHFMRDSTNPSAHIQDLPTDLPSIIRLFDHSLVLDYQNGSVWYQVPQLVRAHV